jgi:hypothetical protein
MRNSRWWDRCYEFREQYHLKIMLSQLQETCRDGTTGVGQMVFQRSLCTLWLLSTSSGVVGGPQHNYCAATAAVGFKFGQFSSGARQWLHSDDCHDCSTFSFE